MTVYTYGSTVLHDGINYYLQEKPFNLVPYVQTLHKIARQDGMKLSGQSVDARVMQLKVKIVGSSRIDLENRLSTLNAGLALRQQQLRIYATDARYYIADYIGNDPTTDVMLLPGQPNSILVILTFVCQQPYAYAATQSTFDTGQFTLAGSVGAGWSFPVQTIIGGGNIASRPLIRVYQQGTSLTWTSIQIVQQNDGQLLKITTGMPTVSGDFVDFFCDPVAAVTGQTIQKNDNGTLLDFTGQFPTQNSAATLWAITIGAPSAPQARAVWTWTPRYLP